MSIVLKATTSIFKGDSTMSFTIHHAGVPTPAVNAVLHDDFHFSLIIEGLNAAGTDPEAVVGDDYEVHFPAGAINFDNNNVHVAVVGPAPDHRAELVFSSTAIPPLVHGGFIVPGTHNLQIRKVGNPTVLATLAVIVATPVAVPPPPVVLPAVPLAPAAPAQGWLASFMANALNILGATVVGFLYLTGVFALLFAFALPFLSIWWIAKNLDSSSKPPVAVSGPTVPGTPAASAVININSPLVNMPCCTNGTCKCAETPVVPGGGGAKTPKTTTSTTCTSGCGHDVFPNVWPSPCTTCST